MSMPSDETPLPFSSEELRADILRLSKYSEQLRVEAKKNAEQADALVRRVREIEKRLEEAKARKAKKTTGRIL